ncbi:MAG: hypothetical protein JXR19_11870, partial [Bacteroidia bacterium]
FPYHTTGHHDIENIEKLIQHREFDVISVMGGDGTINIVANALGQSDIPLHIIPCGSGNDLVSKISPKPSLDAHFKKLLDWQVMEIDSWLCNNKRFVSCFGIGFDGRVCQINEQNRNKYIPKALVYWIAIFRVLFAYKEIDIEVNNEKKSIFLLSLSNNDRFGGGFLIAPLADMTDKLLEWVSIGKTSILQRIKHLLQLKNGKHLDLPMVDYKRVESCSIYSEKNVPAHVDGELLFDHSYVIRYDRKIKLLF